MADTQEAFSDIIAKMQRDGVVHNSIPTKYLNAYADRLDAAHKREITILRDALAEVVASIEVRFPAIEYALDRKPYLDAKKILEQYKEEATVATTSNRTHTGGLTMELNKFNKRLIAARRPFSVVEIKNDPSITNVNGKRSSYNLVGKGGYGIAEFGCDEWAALWFCEAANRYADEIYSRRSTTPHSEKEGVTDVTNNNSKAREVLNRVHEFLSNLCRDARCDARCSECIGASDLADDVYDVLHAPSTAQEGGAK